MEQEMGLSLRSVARLFYGVDQDQGATDGVCAQGIGSDLELGIVLWNF
jgi:hypothetical protein